MMYVRRSMDDCVVFVTEERLGQMHLHLLSSYCAWNHSQSLKISTISDWIE